ncbi:MAG: nuclease-related domain-containing protein [Verrucomicrobiota bacterium]|nr:nuclease-related domain-containing protein [Verrucomicrobiota bacterium]
MQILLVSWSVGLALTIPFTWWLFTIIRKRDNYNLGFSGEQAVGEKLNLLMLDGYRVFHDFPCPRWNIDHIIVGPSGVYAVETKTRRKRRIAGKKAPQIFFDGKSLDFGQGKETSPLDQAERNARWLSDTLSKALAEPIQVQPVLTFPGWWVERQGQGKVLVLNHKEFYLILKRNGSALLSQQTIDRIVHRLEEKCRNVKF